MNNENKETETAAAAEIKPSSIHTLENDLAAVVRDENYGKNIIKIVTDPNSRGVNSSFDNNDTEKTSILNKKNIVITVIILLLIFSSVSIYALISKSKTDTIVDNDTLDVSSTSTQESFINYSDVLKPEIIQTVDSSKLNKFEIINELNKVKQGLIDKGITSNNNIGLNVNLKTVEFFEKIRYSGNESFLRSLGGKYAFGFYSLENNLFETYIFLEIENFDLAFKSILEWERYMELDLKDIFVGNNTIVEQTSSATTSTSTETVVNYYKKNTETFIDKILKNQDIREYVNNENNTTLIYGFINNKYLIITSGESSFIDIRDRLLKQNIVR